MSELIRSAVSEEESGTFATISTRSVAERLDNTFQTSYLSSQGHIGSVTCVDGSDGMDYVVTGGEDSTARVWKLDEKEFACYRLFCILEHRHPHGAEVPEVTSVAFHGVKGPVVTVTDQGGLFVWSLPSGEMSQLQHEQESIIDIDTKRGAGAFGRETLILGYAFGKQAKLTKACLRCEIDTDALDESADNNNLQNARGKYVLEELAEMVHESKVWRVQHIPGSIEEGAAIATCDNESIILWTMQGAMLQKLRPPSNDPQVKTFTISPTRSDDSAWIVLACQNTLCLWHMDGGKIVGEDFEAVEDLSFGERQTHRVCSNYKIPSGIVDIAMDPDNVFIVVTRMDTTTQIIQIQAKASSALSPADMLLEPGQEETLFEIPHSSKPTEMCVYRDNKRNGAALIVGFEDGTCELWDLDGYDIGEKIAELRSVKLRETLVPVGLLLVSFLQVVSFAFGPATSWEDDVEKPMKVTADIVWIDTRIIFTIDHAALFWPEAFVTIGCMFCFVVFAATGIPERLEDLQEAVYRGGYGSSCCMQFAKLFVFGLRRTASVFMMAMATVLVVPVFKVCAMCVDCIHPLDGMAPYLTANHEILCYESEHFILVCTLIVLLPCYFYLLVPHAAVSGDVKYVKRSNLCSFQYIRSSTVRKACLYDQGPVHPIHEYVFTTKVLQLISKSALPCISVLTTSKPLLQMVGICCIGAIMFINTLLHPPLVHKTWNAVVQGSHLFTFCATICGVITVILPRDRTSTIGLIMSALCVSAFIYCRADSSRKIKVRRVDGGYTDLVETPESA